jgi:hypothetical protein
LAKRKSKWILEVQLKDGLIKTAQYFENVPSEWKGISLMAGPFYW